MGGLSSLPLRWEAAERPPGLPVRIPPERLAPLRGGLRLDAQAGRPPRARERVTFDGRATEFEGLAVVDETAGYHTRETEWRWSAGVGYAADGSPVGWNLVSGVNDGPIASERSVWSDAGARGGAGRFRGGSVGGRILGGRKAHLPRRSCARAP